MSEKIEQCAEVKETLKTPRRFQTDHRCYSYRLFNSHQFRFYTSVF